MDGNGRWADAIKRKRIYGHEMGVEAVKKIVEHCVKLKVDFLTLYTFSNENWNRPKYEVLALMRLLVKSLDKYMNLLLDNNIKLNVIGDVEKLDLITKRKLNLVINKTKEHNGLNLNLAISYGSRQEIINAVNKILNLKENKKINIEKFNSYLYTSEIPDPDLLIRTGKEFRISNFLLWQIAYTEIYFSDVYWPDFNEKQLNLAISDYQKRERRFGKIN